MVPHQFINLNPCAQKEARAILYEVKINPFRKEFFISGIPPKLNLVLGTKLVILCGKELLLGTLKNQRLFFEDNYYETISEHYSKYSPHIHYEFIPSELSNNQDFCQIVRIATEDDLALRANLEREFPSLKAFFEGLLNEFKLPAKIVYLDISLNRYKIYVYFISPQKINYQVLHEQASEKLKSRVEIKQVGSRDYARALGGIGICGRRLCCESFLTSIPPVTLAKIRSANIVFDPEKLSGVCSKLRCCLLYEIYNEEETQND